MKWLTATVLTIALGTVSACGSGGGDETATVDPDPAQTTAVPTVSARTTCDLLFKQGDPPPWDKSVALAQKDTYSSGDSQHIADVADRLDEIAESAETALAEHIRVMADDMRNLGELVETGSGRKDLGGFRTSGLEVGNSCAPYVALD